MLCFYRLSTDAVVLQILDMVEFGNCRKCQKCTDSTQIHPFLGPFLTAMTFYSIGVEFYMTKISILTAFFSVRLRYLFPRGAKFNRFCAVFMCARKKARCLLKRNLNIVCALFKRNLNMMC